MNNSSADHHQLLMLSSSDVRQLLTEAVAEQAVRTAYILSSSKEASTLPLLRQSLGENSAFGIKGAVNGKEKQLGFKAAGYWPKNRLAGMDAHQATVILLDHDSGRPKAIMDGNLITTMRTGAAGGVAIDALARADAQVLGVIGTGVQGLVQAQFALRARPGVREIRYLERRSALEDKFLANLRGRVRLTACATADDVVNGADIVITATSARAPLFSAEAVRPGTHINAVGADTVGKRELPAALLPSSKIFVDLISQCRTIGELQWAAQIEGIDIGDVLRGQISGRETTDDITVFDMTGIGLLDLICAHAIFEAAVERGLGMALAWPAG